MMEMTTEQYHNFFAANAAQVRKDRLRAMAHRTSETRLLNMHEDWVQEQKYNRQQEIIDRIKANLFTGEL
jgi:hypothetical protein